MYNLLNRKVIPKDVDLTPAFKRGGALLQTSPAIINDISEKFYEPEYDKN